MAKRFKLKFPNINISSFQFCRPKCSSSSSLPKNPIPVKYRLSPVNPKCYEITYPSSSPAPPPSTPEYSLSSPSSKPPPPPRPKTVRSSNGGGSVSEFRRSAAVKATPSSKNVSKSKKKTAKKSRKPSHVFTLISSDEDEGGEEEEEEEDENNDDDDSLVLLDSSRSFSSDQFYNPRGSSQKCRYRASRSAPPIQKKTAAAAAAEQKKVRESVAVVKRSEDPYEDFKRSMLEMITEKQIFRVVDLEELLQCFLTLNSKQYHGIIVEAFSEIWEILFSDYSTRKHRLSI